MRRARRLVRQHQPLGHAETMLFVDHDERQIAVAYRVLKDRMRSDQYVDAAVGKPHQRRFARPSFVAAGQDGEIDGEPGEH